MAYESGNVRPGANTIVDIYSLFLNIIILCFYLSFYHHVILIAFKKQNTSARFLRNSDNP
jgi:hypothetical protein